MDTENKLRQLKDMYDKGLISPEVYAEQQRSLLSSLTTGNPANAPPGTANNLKWQDTIQPPKTRPIFLLVALFIAGLLFLFWRSSTSNSSAPPSAGLAAIVRQPKKIVDERIALNEGQSMMYSFSLNTDARVELKIDAGPKPVDAMLMTPDEAEKFRKVQGQLFGGQYNYRQNLSSKQILQIDKTEIIPAGNWVIVILRPSESLFQSATNASITVYSKGNMRLKL